MRERAKLTDVSGNGDFWPMVQSNNRSVTCSSSLSSSMQQDVHDKLEAASTGPRPSVEEVKEKTSVIPVPAPAPAPAPVLVPETVKQAGDSLKEEEKGGSASGGLREPEVPAWRLIVLSTS
jgi:hypothetical protein